jgi:hypothetical protein
MQYHSADAAVGTTEMALSARSEKIIVRMAFPPSDKGVKTIQLRTSNIGQSGRGLQPPQGGGTSAACPAQRHRPAQVGTSYTPQDDGALCP